MKILTQPFHDFHKMQAEGIRTRDGHIVSELLSADTVEGVTILNRPLSISEAFAKNRLKEFAPRSLFTPGCSVSTPMPRLKVVQVTLPHVLRPLTERRDYWATALGSDYVQRITSRMAAEVDVLLLSNPLAYPLLRVVPNGVLVAFDAIDDWSNHPEMRDPRGRIAHGYSEILKRADVVVTNAEAMQRRLIERGAKNPLLIRNGVPSAWLEMESWSRPAGPIVLGYAGKLAKRIDVTTLSMIAASRPSWRLELAGPVLDKAWIRPLLRHPNVVWHGDVPHETLPELFRRWHVGLIPHNVGSLENGGHPIKLYEYLAIGMPVVSTPIGGIDALGDLPVVAPSGPRFLEAIQSALSDENSKSCEIERRRRAVRPWTWTRTADDFLAALLGRERSAG